MLNTVALDGNTFIVANRAWQVHSDMGYSLTEQVKSDKEANTVTWAQRAYGVAIKFESVILTTVDIARNYRTQAKKDNPAGYGEWFKLDEPYEVDITDLQANIDIYPKIGAHQLISGGECEVHKAHISRATRNGLGTYIPGESYSPGESCELCEYPAWGFFHSTDEMYEMMVILHVYGNSDMRGKVFGSKYSDLNTTL